MSKDDLDYILRMKFVILGFLLVAAMCSDLIVTKEYIEQLKETVNWEVEDYENSVFRGWTIEEAKNFLGLVNNDEEKIYPEYESETPPPAELSWVGADCIHEVRNQGNCGSCWAFAATGMLTDRCCMYAKDQGWLAPQELVSCERFSHGCRGGYMESPISYMVNNGGLVPEACYPYQAKDLSCPSKCVNGSDWRKAHVCKCNSPKSCSGTSNLKSCLKSGPVSASFMICQSFFMYKSGIYHCDCGSYLGGHAVLAVGFGDTPECYFLNRNSWSHVWGDKGYFKIGCSTCRYSGGYMCSTVS